MVVRYNLKHKIYNLLKTTKDENELIYLRKKINQEIQNLIEDIKIFPLQFRDEKPEY